MKNFSFTSDNNTYGLTDKYILFTTNGWETYTIIDSTVTDVMENNEFLLSFNLYPNYPNPFNPTTKIRFEIPKRDYVRLNIYNLSGEKISELFEGEIASGIHEVVFNASNLPSGIYFYQIKTSEYQQAKKCLLLTRINRKEH